MRVFCERLPQAIVLATLIGLPWFFGGVDGSTIFVVACLITASFALLFAQVTKSAVAWGSIRFPLCLLTAAAVLGVVQSSPAIESVVQKILPSATAVRDDFAAEPQHPAPEPQPLSLHAVSTRRQLAELVGAIAAFMLGAVLFSERQALLALFTCVAATAAAVSFFGILQKLSWNGLIYWTFSSELGLPFGPFINRNNAGGFLEIGLACAAGLLVWQFVGIPPFRSTERGFDPTYSNRNPRRAGIGERCAWLIAHLNTPLLCAATAAFLITAGILISLSRGAFISLTLGTTAALAWRTLESRFSIFSWVPALFIAAAVGFVGWLGQTETVHARLQTLTSFRSVQEDQRLAHWQTAWSAAQDFQPFGSGLGTYRFAYTRYQKQPTDRTFYFAENQYLDTLVTAGWSGVGLLTALWLVAAWAVHGLFRAAKTPADHGIAFAAALLLATQTVHACFDFALYIPACYLTFAVLAGALLRRSAYLRSPFDPTTTEPRRFGKIVAVAALVIMFAALVASSRELYAAWAGRSALRDTSLAPNADHPRDAAWTATAVDTLRNAITLQPDDGELHVRLAEMLIERYRLAFRNELANMAVDPMIWQWETPNRLHADAHLLARIQDDSALAALRNNPLVAQHLKPALAEARAARTFCPLAPYGHMIVAKLCFLDESPLHDQFYLDRVERLVDGRTDWLFEIGALHIDSARLERGFAAWRRTWELSSKHEAFIVRTASAYLTPANLLKKIVPPSPETILRVARSYFREPDQEHVRRAFYQAALALISAEPRPSADDCQRAALCEAELGDLSAAAQWYQRALGLNDQRADWFFEAAEICARQGDWQTAATHARQAFRLSPDNANYRELLTRTWNEVEALDRPQTPANPKN